MKSACSQARLPLCIKSTVHPFSMATVNPEVTLVNSSAVQPATGIWDTWHLIIPDLTKLALLWSGLRLVGGLEHFSIMYGIILPID